MARKSGFPLKKTIIEILQSGPKTADEILAELEKRGYAVSANPRRRGVVKGLLTKMVKKGELVKEGDKYALPQ